jgi:hypothetical protein
LETLKGKKKQKLQLLHSRGWMEVPGKILQLESRKVNCLLKQETAIPKRRIQILACYIVSFIVASFQPTITRHTRKFNVEEKNK